MATKQTSSLTAKKDKKEKKTVFARDQPISD
jgi:hypothetical protein